MGSKYDNRVKRLQWRRHPHSPAELTRAVMRATAISPNCMPAWVDVAMLVPFYAEALRLTRCGVAHEVDHHYPLTGETVCGLHVPENLQVITAAANLAKGKRLIESAETWPAFDMPRSPRKSGRRPTNQPYRLMFPNGIFKGRCK